MAWSTRKVSWAVTRYLPAVLICANAEAGVGVVSTVIVLISSVSSSVTAIGKKSYVPSALATASAAWSWWARQPGLGPYRERRAARSITFSMLAVIVSPVVYVRWAHPG